MIFNPVHPYVKRWRVFASCGEDLKCLKGKAPDNDGINETWRAGGADAEKLLVLLKIGACFLERLTKKGVALK